MNINELTIGQAKELANMFGNNNNQSQGINHLVGEKVIIRTYSAGNWFGILEQKSGNEVILKDARRMWRWWAKQGVSLSAVALYGIKENKSKIIEAVDSVWLEAVEIIPCNKVSIKDLEGAKNVTAE